MVMLNLWMSWTETVTWWNIQSWRNTHFQCQMNSEGFLRHLIKLKQQMMSNSFWLKFPSILSSCNWQMDELRLPDNWHFESADQMGNACLPDNFKIILLNGQESKIKSSWNYLHLVRSNLIKWPKILPMATFLFCFISISILTFFIFWL